MSETGFLDQRPRSISGFGLVLLLHAAAIAGVVAIKVRPPAPPSTPLDTYAVPNPPPPLDDEPPPPPPDRVERVPPPRTSTIDAPRPEVPSLPRGPVVPPSTAPARYNSGPIGEAPVAEPTPPATLPRTEPIRTAEARPIDPPRPTPPPVRVAAQFDPRFAGAMQPPYPVAEERAEREGSVSVRVTIAPTGRVTAVTRLSATSDAFWRVTERQALGSWRFRPATLDGRPVEGEKTLTVHFRLDGQ